MQNQLKHITLPTFTTESGVNWENLKVSYQSFGQPLHTAPVVLVNHALTGNSQVIGEKGWWNSLIGDDKLIDTKLFTVLAINIPGNGFGNELIENYKAIVCRDIAKVFIQVIESLGIKQLHSIIGGSLGGGIAWEMAVLKPNIAAYLIPIASDWKSSDWLIANCLVQEQILQNSTQPIHDARIHAMLGYRSPKSFRKRFKRTLHETENLFNIETWLLYHGDKLQGRFQLSAYRLMNHLLRTLEASSYDRFDTDLAEINAEIHLVAVDSDLLFTANEIKETFHKLKPFKSNVFYHEIKSIHGHDAFLIEFKQLEELLKPVFQKEYNLHIKKA